MKWSDITLGFFIARRIIIKGNRSVIVVLLFVLSLIFFNLLFVRSFLAGFSDGVLQSLIETSTSHIALSPQETPLQKKYIVNQEELRRQIETIPGVIATTRHYFLSATIAADKNNTGELKYVPTSVLGFNQREEKNVININTRMVSGYFPDNLKDDEVVIGTYLAGGYDSTQTIDLGGVRAGDKVHIIYPNGADKIYTVKGVFYVAIGSVGSEAFLSDKEAERMLSVYNQASEILIKVDLKRHSIEEYEAKIKILAPELKIEKYTKRLASAGILVDAFNLVALLIVGINVFVTTTTIFIIIYIVAMTRKKQIGILKAIGIREQIIEAAYVFQAIFFAIFSSLFGTLFFYVIVKPYLTAHPIIMPFGDSRLVITYSEVFVSALSVVLAATIAGFISSRIIAKKQIVVTIWG